MFKTNARQAERAFVRRLTKTGKVLTANGRANVYISHDREAIVLQTAKGSGGYQIKRKSLRAAITFTCYQRTITRKDLEVYCKFSSALLGILIEVFETRAKMIKTPTGLLRLTLIGIRYFFAGVDRAVRDLEAAAGNGAKFVLMSYYHIRDRKAWKVHVERLGLKVLLDSGEFTRWKAEQKGNAVKPIHVNEYADFIEAHREVLFARFNLDRVGDPEASKKNAEYLKGRGLAPVEIWHVGSSPEALDELVAEDLPVIAIGGHVGLSEKARKEAFDQVFKRHPKQNFHFLGGSSRLLFEFPWFSADSTGWVACRKYGVIIDQGGQQKAPEGWTGMEALEYTVRELVKLEEIFPEAEVVKEVAA